MCSNSFFDKAQIGVVGSVEGSSPQKLVSGSVIVKFIHTPHRDAVFLQVEFVGDQVGLVFDVGQVTFFMNF